MSSSNDPAAKAASQAASSTNAVNAENIARLAKLAKVPISALSPPSKTVSPNVLTVDRQEYSITDENREEITKDFMDYHVAKFDFVEKWKAFHIGPVDKRFEWNGPALKKEDHVYKADSASL